MIYFIGTGSISIGVHIGDKGGKELRKLHILRTDHVMIQSELQNLIGAKYIGTSKCNWGPVPTHQTHHGFMGCPGENPNKGALVGFLNGSESEPNCVSSPNLDRWVITQTNC
jgi:hypothetical protein